MRKSLLIALLMALSWSAQAADTRYVMRVDGLACPYCAYGIEKKLKKIEGARDIHIDLDSGLVEVTVPDGTELTEAAMKKLFNDAGFTFRGIRSREPA